MKNQKIKIETKVEESHEEKPEDILQVEKISSPNKVVSNKKRKKNLSNALKPRKYGKLHYIYQSYRLDIQGQESGPRTVGQRPSKNNVFCSFRAEPSQAETS